MKVHRLGILRIWLYRTSDMTSHLFILRGALKLRAHVLISATAVLVCRYQAWFPKARSMVLNQGAAKRQFKSYRR